MDLIVQHGNSAVFIRKEFFMDKNKTKTTFKMRVWIYDPNTEKGMCSDIMYDLICRYFYDSENYGNGYYLSITAEKNFYEQYYDLRYNTEFDPDKKESFLIDWANSYWCGENGAYKVKSITIEKVEE